MGKDNFAIWLQKHYKIIFLALHPSSHSRYIMVLLYNNCTVREIFNAKTPGRKGF